MWKEDAGREQPGFPSLLTFLRLGRSMDLHWFASVVDLLFNTLRQPRIQLSVAHILMEVVAVLRRLVLLINLIIVNLICIT